MNLNISFSLFSYSRMMSSILGVTGFSCLWSIHEIIEQEERVKKGWFPRNAKKNYK